jgi:hypothetical protein
VKILGSLVMKRLEIVHLYLTASVCGMFPRLSKLEKGSRM